VSATGINIWLEKRKYRDALNVIWPGLVWGTPLTLALAAFAQVILQLPAAPVYWGGLVLAMTTGLFLHDEHRYTRQLKVMTAIVIVLLGLAESLKVGRAACSPAGLPVSRVLVSLALGFLFAGRDRSAVRPLQFATDGPG